MTFRTYLAIFLILPAIFLSACGGAAENATLSNTNVSNANTGRQIANNPLSVATPTPVAVTNDAPTLGPVFKAYCAARVRKDEAALKKIFSSETIRDIQRQMKEDGVKTIVEYLETEEVTNDLCEVTNERIEGNTAVARVRVKWAPNGVSLKFVKENGEWKLTTESPDFDALKK